MEPWGLRTLAKEVCRPVARCHPAVPCTPLRTVHNAMPEAANLCDLPKSHTHIHTHTHTHTISDTRSPSHMPHMRPTGLRVLDVGCGGGILSESLARLGAQVTGIDVTRENVEAARLHAAADPAVAERVRCGRGGGWGGVALGGWGCRWGRHGWGVRTAGRRVGMAASMMRSGCSQT